MVEGAKTSGFERKQLTHQPPRVDLDAPRWVPNTSTPAGYAGRIDRMDGAPFLPDGFDCNLYAPIRLYDLASGDKEMINKLVELKRHDEILCILELEDESFELGVLKTYIPELGKLLETGSIQCSVDWEHQPFDPSFKEVQSFCSRHPELSGDHTKAKLRMKDQFCRRAEEICRNGWSMHRFWYSHLVELIPN